MTSNATIEQMLRIMVEEVGAQHTARIAERLVQEVKGNKSYTLTVRKLYSAALVYCRTQFPKTGRAWDYHFD